MFGLLESALHKPFGALVLVVGPSGVGKDTLIALAKEQLPEQEFHFPSRHITRPKDSGGEDHNAVSQHEFSKLQSDDAFILNWFAHDLHYGISNSILDHLRFGKTVVVNVSRTVIEEAQNILPNVKVISISASRETLLKRLRNRGRETSEDVERRLNRVANYKVVGDNIHTIKNDGPLAKSLEEFMSLLR